MMAGYAFHVRLFHSLLSTGFHRRLQDVPYSYSTYRITSQLLLEVLEVPYKKNALLNKLLIKHFYLRKRQDNFDHIDYCYPCITIDYYNK